MHGSPNKCAPGKGGTTSLLTIEAAWSALPEHKRSTSSIIMRSLIIVAALLALLPEEVEQNAGQGAEASYVADRQENRVHRGYSEGHRTTSIVPWTGGRGREVTA